MKLQRTWVLLVGLLLISVSPASARKWTSSTGKFSVEAELVEVKDGSVKLKRQDGKVITVPVSKLSKGDRDHLAELAKAKAPKLLPIGNSPFADLTWYTAESLRHVNPLKEPIELPAAARRAGKMILVVEFTGDSAVELSRDELTKFNAGHPKKAKTAWKDVVNPGFFRVVDAQRGVKPASGVKAGTAFIPNAVITSQNTFRKKPAPRKLVAFFYVSNVALQAGELALRYRGSAAVKLNAKNRQNKRKAPKVAKPRK